MNEFKDFSITVDGIKHKALVIWTYKLDGNVYCIYAIKDNNKNYNIYTGEVINNTVVPLQEKNKEIANKITDALVSQIKR